MADIKAGMNDDYLVLQKNFGLNLYMYKCLQSYGHVLSHVHM